MFSLAWSESQLKKKEVESMNPSFLYPLNIRLLLASQYSFKGRLTRNDEHLQLMISCKVDGSPTEARNPSCLLLSPLDVQTAKPGENPESYYFRFPGRRHNFLVPKFMNEYNKDFMNNTKKMTEYLVEFSRSKSCTF